MKWFTSDLHFGARKRWDAGRGLHFDIDEWDKFISNQIKLRFNKGDELFVLGDMTSYGDPEKYRHLLPSNTWLIKGNHDGSDGRCTRVFGKMFRYYHTTKVVDQPTFLCHYPTVFWPGSHKGHYHIAGHTHDQREATLDEWMPERRSTDVSPETAFRLFGQYRPINEYEIDDLLGGRAGHDLPDFYEEHRNEF